MDFLFLLFVGEFVVYSEVFETLTDPTLDGPAMSARRAGSETPGLSMPLVPGYYGIHRLTNFFFRAPLSEGHTAVSPLLLYPTCWVASLGVSHIGPTNYAVWNWAWFGETAGLLPNLGLGSFFHDNSHGITWVLRFVKLMAEY